MLDDRPTCGIAFDSEELLFARGIQLGEKLTLTTGLRHEEWGGDWADIHDVLIHNDMVYLASTHHNAVVVVDPETGVERHRWAFSDMEDAWHLNCLGVVDGSVHFTAFGTFSETRGYKERSDGQGFMRGLDAAALPWVAGLSQPHSILATDDAVYLCNSEKHEVWRCSKSRAPERVLNLGGYTRGLALRDGVLYVGLSASRNTPEDEAQTAAILVAVDVQTWRGIARMPVPSMEVYGIVALADAESFGWWTECILLGERERLMRALTSATKKLVEVTNENHRLKVAFGLP